MLRMLENVPGDVVECGVGWGRSLLPLAILVRLEEKGRKVWGFDSFEGFPDPSPEDASPRNVQKGEWKTDMLSVLKMLRSSGLDTEFINSRFTLIKGFFKESLESYRGDSVALLHIDVDLYQSYLDVLERLYPQVAPGGVIMFDEYANTMEYLKFPGAKKAIDEYFKGKEPILRDPISGKYYTIKRSN
jgi:O-methyltransferase